MFSTFYPLTGTRLRELTGDLAAPIEGAMLALVRLDERLGRSDSQLAAGVRGRAHLGEAQALVQLAGELVRIEELVLHVAGMDVRTPGTGVVRAARILTDRQRLASRLPDRVLQTDAIGTLLGLSGEKRTGWNGADGVHDPGGGLADGAGPVLTPGRDGPPVSPTRAWEMPRPLGGTGDGELEQEEDDRLADGDNGGEGFNELWPAAGGGGEFAAIDQLIARTSRTFSVASQKEGPPAVQLHDPRYGAENRLAAWRTVLDQSRPLPGALAAALALDAWLTLEPAERAGDVGWTLAATVLRARGLAEHHLPALGLAYCRGRFRWSPHLPLERRLEGLLAAVAESARLAGADLKRLTLAREVMQRRCENRRGNSRLRELVGLFVELPLVTTALATERLKVTPQAVDAMLKELGPAVPRELTGRKRYRAWGIV